MTENRRAYETYPRPAPFVAPERWEQPLFAASPPPASVPDEPETSTTPAGGEREIEP
ncbi:MAG: hypothetical protein HY829_12185 [Actinobacteria bacterium]|nr:hypothetical protein [Actinomycetota bacterium]